MAVKNWRIDGDFAYILYEDGDEIKVSKDDFNRAFGTIISASKENVIRDFAVSIDADIIVPKAL